MRGLPLREDFDPLRLNFKGCDQPPARPVREARTIGRVKGARIGGGGLE